MKVFTRRFVCVFYNNAGEVNAVLGVKVLTLEARAFEEVAYVYIDLFEVEVADLSYFSVVEVL